MLFSQLNLKRSQHLSIVLVCLLGAGLIWSVVQIRNNTQPIAVYSKGVQYLADQQAALTFEQILTLPDSQWQTENHEELSFGMIDHPFWFRFQMDSDRVRERVLEIDYALLDKVDIWFLAEGKIIEQFQQGDSYPFAHRVIQHEKLLLPVRPLDTEMTVVIRAETTGTMRLPLRLWQKEAYTVYNGEHNLVMGLFFGFMGAMALSNLFFFVTTRSITFISYCGYVAFLALSLATLHGLSFKYLWPDNLWLQSRAIGITGTLTIFFALIFSLQLLDVKVHAKHLYKAGKIILGIHLVGLAASMLIPYSVYIKLFLFLLVLTVLIIYSIGFYLWYRGIKLASFYTLAWTMLLIGASIASLDNWDLIELETPPHYMLMFAATVETFLLALALAMNYNQQRQELFETQALALEKERHAREAKEEILRVQEQAQEELEYKVQERTLELEITLRELSETNRELEKRSTMDALTGIRNREFFDKKYQAEVRRSRREQTELSIVMLDIDHFKSINDQHGHIAGDECIKQVAQVLKQNLRRPSDEVCRYGGEEFALILPNTSQQGALQVVESMRAELQDMTVNTPDGDVSLTISAGICTAAVQSLEDEKGLLQRADEALYQAKNLGRNRIEVLTLEPKVAANQD